MTELHPKARSIRQQTWKLQPLQAWWTRSVPLATNVRDPRGTKFTSSSHEPGPLKLVDASARTTPLPRGKTTRGRCDTHHCPLRKKGNCRPAVGEAMCKGTSGVVCDTHDHSHEDRGLLQLRGNRDGCRTGGRGSEAGRVSGTNSTCATQAGTTSPVGARSNGNARASTTCPAQVDAVGPAAMGPITPAGPRAASSADQEQKFEVGRVYQPTASGRSEGFVGRRCRPCRQDADLKPVCE